MFKEYTEDQFIHFMHNIELGGWLCLIAGLFLKIFVYKL